MIKLEIPGWKKLNIKYLVCDYNGTLACDGKLLPELAEILINISEQVQVFVITADTFGIAAEQLIDLPVKLEILSHDRQAERKVEFVKELGCDDCVCLGNGRNDRLMLQKAALGICLLQKEGAAAETVQAADVVCNSAADAMQLLLHPRRLIATLRC